MKVYKYSLLFHHFFSINILIILLLYDILAISLIDTKLLNEIMDGNNFIVMTETMFAGLMLNSDDE